MFTRELKPCAISLNVDNYHHEDMESMSNPTNGGIIAYIWKTRIARVSE
jgi:hypothetical protein